MPIKTSEILTQPLIIPVVTTPFVFSNIIQPKGTPPAPTEPNQTTITEAPQQIKTYVFNQDFKAPNFVFNPTAVKIILNYKDFKKGDTVDATLTKDFGGNDHIVTSDGFDITAADTSITQGNGLAPTITQGNGLATTNIFTKTWAWAKANPFKAVIAGAFIVAVLAVIFNKSARRFFGLAKKNN